MLFMTNHRRFSIASIASLCCWSAVVTWQPSMIAAQNVYQVEPEEGWVTIAGAGDAVAVLDLDGLERRNLQGGNDESLFLYEYELTFEVATPWSYFFDECLEGHNWENGTKPDNFTWYGLRVMLPDDVVGYNSFSFSNIAYSDPEDGVVQPYGQDERISVANITFSTPQLNPTIRMNINNDLVFQSLHFNLDEVDDGEFVETKRGYQISCLIEESESSEVYSGAVDATLFISMKRTGVDPSVTSMLSAATKVWGVSSTIILAAAAAAAAMALAGM